MSVGKPAAAGQAHLKQAFEVSWQGLSRAGRGSAGAVLTWEALQFPFHKRRPIAAIWRVVAQDTQSLLQCSASTRNAGG